MKFECECGHVIADQTDFLPYKAYLLRDEDYERFWDILDVIADFIAALRSGRRDRWVLSRKFTPDIEDGSLIFHLIRQERERYFVHAYECEQCGRLWVERERGPTVGRFVGFAPDSGRYERVLASLLGPPRHGRPT